MGPDQAPDSITRTDATAARPRLMPGLSMVDMPRKESPPQRQIKGPRAAMDEKKSNTMRIMCPNLQCRSMLAVPNSARGRTVRCRSCGTTIRVPSGSSEPKKPIEQP